MSDDPRSAKYHSFATGTDDRVHSSDMQLEQWAADPNCLEAEECAALLAERRAKREQEKAEQEVQAAAARLFNRDEVRDNPFNPRTEISADAKHIAGRIVTHLWIIFVLLPVAAALLFWLLR
jgi:hypothetical protein